MNHSLCCLKLLVLLSLQGLPSSAADFIVQDGKPTAEIVVSGQPSRSAKLAAMELQLYLKKISGAELPVVVEPSGDVDTAIYVGQSTFTDQAEVTSAGLVSGGFLMLSTANALYLLGNDLDYQPVEPWARSNDPNAQKAALQQWDALTHDAKWGCQSLLRRWQMYDRKLDLWSYDEFGTLNAVYEFLRTLGVRWYMPGDLGEIVPHMASIPLPAVELRMNPDFETRRFVNRFKKNSPDYTLWTLRMGLNWGLYGTTAHGLNEMTARDEFKAMHPDYFALYGNKRATNLNQLCLSSEGLFKETVSYVRACYDILHYDTVSIMPNDAYTALCQCELCEGKATYERGYRGRLSDHVWGFVNRVAIEVAKTHPDKTVNCLAYGAYLHPPLAIERLNRNVIVGIVGGRRPKDIYPEQRSKIRELREAWLQKTPNRIYIFENYPMVDRGYLPFYISRTAAESLNEVKGISMGDDVWFDMGNSPIYEGSMEEGGYGMKEPGFYHLNAYITARFYWGGQRDYDTMMDEYYRLYYGPARAEMKAFIEYCEANWPDMTKDRAKINRTFELLEAAQRAVNAESVHGRRIALIQNYLQTLRDREIQLAQERTNVISLRVQRVDRGEEPVIDGKFDDPFWEDITACINGWKSGSLKVLDSGNVPIYKTFVRIGVSGSDIYFAITCNEEPGRGPTVGTTSHDDPAIWYGDVVEILLETNTNHYYQLAIAPSGAVVDLRRIAKSKDFQWESLAEVSTQVQNDSWTIEARIPYVDENDDPLHMLTARKPAPELPWFFNVCRQRVAETRNELSALSPTGTDTFHEPAKFAKLYEGLTQAEKAAHKK